MPLLVGYICGKKSLLSEIPQKSRANRVVCNATTRKGTRCQAPPVSINNEPKNGRCKLHGGMSTGPRTEKGRAAISASNKRRAKNK
ncbi:MULTISPECIES: HGGxSTG domain-containing protein [Legionella]|uniref:Uncharacterized protein n=1 Tax=Legionella drozanskii LLAP-1 TaxID=1212489 RepID=A0A0W0SMC4_9GAMM|nr:MULTISPECIES: HGGxSTG domain-containing protein [Legionella]KTC84554.1 hypothetical protein Ldro_2718 [Legionella drozanskii LLAP-1]PJE09566.1 MAG: hypothetical protein CK430_10980 [Legionella sp.]